ncbi:MAG: ABC transporter substrate-binding protein [Deltaproteobacteria bacterium]|nr:ABC transporter substrate-binding protein [Deltaproteobacteria bacterium]
MRIFACFLTLVLPALCLAETFPGPDYKETPNPFASPYALVGGEMSVFVGQSPKSLNYYLENSTQASTVFSLMYETLLDMDPLTLDYEPGLASSWTISEDRRTFTFTINEKAKWSDGKPITARDVKWTFDTVMDPKNLTGVHKVSLARFDSPKILDQRTIQFTAKEVHWKNLMALGFMHILPEHAFSGKDFNKINFSFPVVSGRYRMGELAEGMYLDMVRRDDYWNKDSPKTEGVGNFSTLRLKFYGERENAFEALKKGEIDLFPVYTARLWVKEAMGGKFSRNWIVRQKVHNRHPVGFQGFAMNMRKPPFDDIRVRKAMAHLVDREKMNATLMYNQYFLHRSYYEDLYTPENPCENPLIKFDKEKARKLLAEAGYRANPDTGFLEKDGKPLEFRFLTRSASTDKFLSIFAEDLKDVGVRMTVDRKDWAAWAKDMDEYNFEMTWAAWGAGLFKDPEGMWHSSEAARPGGSNITGFANAGVDELIERQKTIFDVQKRHDIVRQIDQIVYRQAPYVLLWNIDYVRLLFWNKFGAPRTTLSMYGREDDAYALWWYDPDSAADLADAMETGEALAPWPEDVFFDQVFEPPKTTLLQ